MSADIIAAVLVGAMVLAIAELVRSVPRSDGLEDKTKEWRRARQG